MVKMEEQFVHTMNIHCRFFCYNGEMNRTGRQGGIGVGPHFLRALQLHCRGCRYERTVMSMIFSQYDAEPGYSARTRLNWHLLPNYSLTIRQRRLVKWPVGK